MVSQCTAHAPALSGLTVLNLTFFQATPPGATGGLPPGLRSLERLRSAFQSATASNPPSLAGLMDASQLAAATRDLAGDLRADSAAGFAELTATDDATDDATDTATDAAAAVAPSARSLGSLGLFRGLDVGEAGVAMALVRDAGRAALGKPRASGAGNAYIEFNQFVMVCVHCVQRPGLPPEEEEI